MKKNIVVICIAVLLVGSIILLSFLLLNKTKALEIKMAKSYFSDYYVKEDKVYIECQIIVDNNRFSELNFTLAAEFHDDAKSGLLKNAYLYGYNSNLSDTLFSIEKGETKTFAVVFIGDFAGKNINSKENYLRIYQFL